MISDMVLLNDLPEKVKDSVLAYVGCVAGADKKDDYLGKIKQAGFEQVEVVAEDHLPETMLMSQILKRSLKSKS